MRSFLALVACILAVSQAAVAAESPPATTAQEYDYGQLPLYHAPVFQRGDKFSNALAPTDPAVRAFLNYYSRYVARRAGAALPKRLREKNLVRFPATRYSDVGPTPREYGGDLPQKDWQFATSSFCRDCHDASLALKDTNPPMRVPPGHGDLFANWSPYGEWSVSLMGLSARDPVFHAQVETERLRHPGVKGSDIDNVCYSCHGPMGQRQVHNDLGRDFDHEMIYATPDNFSGAGSYGKSPQASPKFAKYGALARDSVSCQACHHIGPADGAWRDHDGNVKWEIFYGPKSDEITRREGDKPGPPYPFTANFQTNLNRLYVPDDVKHTEEPMLLAGMARAEKIPHIKSSEYCGTCHVVIVPKIPAGYRRGAPVPGKPGQQYTGNPVTDPNLNLAYEQTTYFEFADSVFPLWHTECQTCHMPGLQPAGEKVVSVSPAWYTPDYPDVPVRNYKRHRLLGINLFVHEMFQQFSGVLGLDGARDDSFTPPRTAANLLSAEQSIVQHATTGPFGEPTAKVEITGTTVTHDSLTVDVQVTNNSGHKFPSGAGFRRGFIDFRVLGRDGKTLWESGRYNRFGVLVGADGAPLPAEFTTDPKKLQPHYQVITRQDQVQIYEVRTTDENNVLTTKTLSLFNDAKDNRILPAGWRPAAAIKDGETRYGLSLKTLATITAPFGVGDDPDYNNPARTGADRLSYRIDLRALRGKPHQVVVAMRYQTIPPYFLVDRYADGYRARVRSYGPATTRLIYLTSRLNTNLDLKSARRSVRDFDVMRNWTMTLSRAHFTFSAVSGFADAGPLPTRPRILTEAHQ